MRVRPQDLRKKKESPKKNAKTMKNEKVKCILVNGNGIKNKSKKFSNSTRVRSVMT